MSLAFTISSSRIGDREMNTILDQKDSLKG